MINLDASELPASEQPLPPATLPEEASKFYEVEVAQGMLISMRDMSFLDQYRSQYKEISRVYSDVRVEFPDGSTKLFTIDEFMERLRG